MRLIGDRWNVTDAEVARHYPCDDVVPETALAAWRGVDVDVAADEVWPWLVQLRLAPYSYDWVDNLGRRSPTERHDLPDPVPGDAFTATGGRPMGTVVAVEHGVHLTARILGAVMSYVVADGRLLLKIVTPRTPLQRAIAPALAVGDLVMARKQLLTLARLAEASRAGG